MDPHELDRLIASRRSNLVIDADSPLDPGLEEVLATAAQFAPNHKRTWPLRICFVTGDSRRGLGDAIADAMEGRGDEASKVEKTRTKFLRAPLIVVVAAASGESTVETEENRYAVAAGVQNMLLTCESRGLAALWGSPAKGANDAITTFCGFDPTDHVMGLVYVGRPRRPAPPVERPAPRVTRRS